MPSAPIAITMGEPAGIGGELAIAAWQTLRADDDLWVEDESDTSDAEPLTTSASKS